MVEMAFFLRFKTQLRRTRPGLIPELEDSVCMAVTAAGGKITGERRMIRAIFDEHSLGFWLDMLILVETLTHIMEGARANLYGYSLLLGRNLPDMTETLCNFLAGGNRGGGVFLDQMTEAGMMPYAAFEDRQFWSRFYAAEHGRPLSGGIFRLNEIKIFVPTAKNGFSLREIAGQALGRPRAGARRSAMIMGPAFEGKRESLYRYCAELSAGSGRDFPPLFIRFGGGGLNALTDAWSAQMRSLSMTAKEPLISQAEEIHALWEYLFRERLREELSPFIIRKARRFCKLLLKFYTDAARQRAAAPVIIIENIHLAEPTAAEIFTGDYPAIQRTPGLVVLGICGDNADPERLQTWEPIFPRLVKLNNEALPAFRQPALTMDLWEIAYACFLLGRYYPPDLLLRLFEEEGKNPAMVSRALSLLSIMGAIDTPLDPRPWMENFNAQAEAALGERKDQVRSLVRSRLLAWVEQKKFNPCFRLLVVLADLDGGKHLNDQLLIKSLVSDLINGTVAGIEQAREVGLLETITGAERAAAVTYILKTMRALLTGAENDIRAAFTNPPPDCASPVLKAQVLVNLTGCHLGLRDNDSALETVKEAIMLSQGKHNFCLAQAYRLFSLVNLTRQQLRETIDYLDFAMSHAEKTGSYHEFAISAYYAAAAQFLFGNVSRAEVFARKARTQALIAGCPEWADRSRFLEGRIAFETGSYRKALELFENIRRGPSGEIFPEKDSLLAAWAYRARVYLTPRSQADGSPPGEKPPGGCHDADLFEVEAAYLAGNYRKAVELSLSLANPHAEENFLYTEQPDWRSGFAQCELLYFSRGELWDRMLCVYHSLALCRLSAAGGEEAMRNMQRILRHEQLSEMDPWDAFYFYAWFRILEQSGAGHVDMNTAITMAFKRLQRRASRIDDIETRRQFLSQPRWNSALNQAAKEFKLI
jgi:tetratricopeptide (TPR) repeat protein